MGLIRKLDPFLAACLAFSFVLPVGTWFEWTPFIWDWEDIFPILLLGQLFALAHRVKEPDAKLLFEFVLGLAISSVGFFLHCSGSRYEYFVPAIWLIAAFPAFLLRQLDNYHHESRTGTWLQFSVRDVVVLLTTVICACFCVRSYQSLGYIENGWLWQMLLHYSMHRYMEQCLH